MKKIIFALLLISIVVIALSCGENTSVYEYKNSSDGSGVEITNYKGTMEKVTVPSEIDGKKVVSIGAAFAENTAIESITLPDTVKNVAAGAFFGCTALKTANLGKTVQKIPDYAFYGCESLEKVSCGEFLSSVGENAFGYCRKFDSFDFNAVEKIGKNAFYNCNSLKRAEMPNLYEMGDSAFYFCNSLESVTFGDSLSEIPRAAFYSCVTLKAVSLPASVKAVCDGAFDYCDSLETVDMPGVKFIEQYAFALCPKLAKVSAPLCETLGEGVFMYDVSLENIDLPSAKEAGDYLFANCTTLKNISLGTDFEKAGRYTFAYCTNLESFNIGENVKELGAGAFAFDVSLEKITSDSAVYTVKDGVLYENENVLHTYPAGLTADSFTAPSGVTAIAEAAFANASLKTVSTGGATTIGDNAFCRCERLETVAMPSVAEIGEGAFAFCFELRSIDVSSYSAYSFDGNALIRDGVLVCFTAGSGIADYTVPDGIKTVAYRAFAGCRGLVKLTVNSTCEKIETEAFCGCTALESAYIAEGISIEKDAFADCGKLTLNGGTEAKKYAQENEIDFTVKTSS